MLLIDIQKEYCRNIVRFFCNEYNTIFKVTPGYYGSHQELKNRISAQIDERLLATRLIKSYRVDVPEISHAEGRDYVIDNVLEDKEIPMYRIFVTILYNDNSSDIIDV